MLTEERFTKNFIHARSMGGVTRSATHDRTGCIRSRQYRKRFKYTGCKWSAH